MRKIEEIKNKIFLEDAFQFLENIPSNSVDLVLTDPPYNLDFSKYDNLDDGTGRRFHYTEKLKWNDYDLKEMSKDLFKEFDRILKESGSIIIFGPQEWAYYYYEPAINNNFDLKCQIVWFKENPIPQLRHKNYRSAHENIIWFARYNKEKVPFTFNFINQQEMKNVFTFLVLQGEERLDHPTQKPLKLIEKLIRIHSNEQDLILDCFLGSGTTAVACIKQNRNYIGCDNNKLYYNMALKRINGLPNTKITQFM